MMQDYIEIVKADGSKEKATVILKFYSKKHKKCYIVYKLDNDNEKYYTSSYFNIDGVVSLNNDLSEEELLMLQKLIEEVVEMN